MFERLISITAIVCQHRGNDRHRIRDGPDGRRRADRGGREAVQDDRVVPVTVAGCSSIPGDIYGDCMADVRAAVRADGSPVFGDGRHAVGHVLGRVDRQRADEFVQGTRDNDQRGPAANRP